MKAEDKILSQFIEKHRMGDWLGFALRAARAEVENEVDGATQNGNGTTVEEAAASAIANESSALPAQGLSFFGRN